MKSFLRKSKASGSDLRKIEMILRRGSRATRRSVAAKRRLNFQGGGEYAR
jgi:hypothetical protein